MRRDLNIVRELEEISTAVASVPAETPYRVPAGYFDTLPEVILANVIARASDETAIVELSGKQPVFEVPDGYFEGLADEILAKLPEQAEQTAAEELGLLSPFLASAPKNTPYQVPPHYFETLKIDITTEEQPVAKVVSMNRTRLWVRFAAAAALLLMITSSLYFFTERKAGFDAVVKQGLKINTEAKFEQSLAEVDNKDLVQYLKATSIGGLEDDNLPAMVESSSLPEETEYLDEEFLDFYLEELEKEVTTTIN